MKIKDGYVLNEIGGRNVAVYIGKEEPNLNGFVNMNGVGAFLWELLTKGCDMEELISAVTEKYEVDAETAAKDVEEFVRLLREKGILSD